MVLRIGHVLSAMTAVAFDRGARDDDTIDRLNHLVMHNLLIFLAVAAITRQYMGTAIYCWSPPEFPEKIHRRYINHYCWVNAMYTIPFDEPVPTSEGHRYFNDVSFYRLTSVMFLALAVLFRVPQILWKELAGLSGANLKEMIGLITETAMMDQDKRDERLGHVTEGFHRWVSNRHIPGKNRCMGYTSRTLLCLFCMKKPSRVSLVGVYLFIKLLYFINAVGQIFIISAFLKTNYWSFGLGAMTSYIKDGRWTDEYNFPRVVHCDYKIRQLENVHTYTVQCVLAINLFLEKIFLLLWFSLMLLMAANLVSLLWWAWQLLSEDRRLRYLGNYFHQLRSQRSVAPEDRRRFFLMIKDYLKADGMFVLKMAAVNTSGMVTLDLVGQIWARYKRAHDDSDVKLERREGKEEINGSSVSAHDSCGR